MKAYTDLEQSKKFAEILPLESADMDYIPIINIDGEYSVEVNEWDNEHIIDEGWIPCWSLAALISVLPEPNLLEKDGWHLFCSDIGHFSSSNNYNNPVDACVEMVLTLHEQKLL